ncbi:MAG: ABC transporter ATP-binding protein [Haliea sp.]|uniref:ABC transporter ATP-binding protein n=1 Tax=Haliea sp. TaxID=1932666 RepID=UPI000C38C1E0|nr:ABC transporter ATP-binding protein [Haliea sp.]MBM68237.1 ABC transporter ATP-binding protein [Haliea sp.]|tara:strand:+ start:8349 stop:9935 length:1587 start_codon:yes stop_codon:yes gene_type:complete
MPLLSVRDLQVDFTTRNGRVTAVNRIGFDVEAGKITAIIGESGSGKSVACYSLLGLLPVPPASIESGSAVFDGRDLLQLSERELRQIRGRDIAMIFQDPMTCLNPYMTVGNQLMEPLLYHRKVTRQQARARALELLAEVGLRDPESTIDQYPHQFSGGMRQRVMIAMALINEPKLLIADEPTTALDVTIQAQILGLIAELQRKRDIGVIFISHDLSVVADIADEIVVMEKGHVVERGDRQAIFEAAEHPYTRKLLAAIPAGSKAPGELPRDDLIQVRNLCTWFSQGRGSEPLRAVDDVSFTVQRGEVLGLVGESGSGKSTIGRSLLRLVPVTRGEVLFDGTDVTSLQGAALKQMRRRMQMIFQDPYASLNPRMSVYDTLAEPLLLHGIESRKTVEQGVLRLMDDVGLARAFVRKYPHEFSGGQRQRIAIGRALATRPEFVVADEPVSALDVTIQAQILELMLELGREYGLTMLFVSHDLAVVRHIADRILVLYKGRVVEQGTGDALFNSPREEYTRQLLQAIPGRGLL